MRLFTAAVVLFLTIGISFSDATDAATKGIAVFLCADSGEFSGAHELGFLQDAMEEREELKLPFCQSAYMGYLRHADGHRIHALTVTTGIGYVSAVVCTNSVLKLRAERNLHFESAVLIGTSGFSPYIGGWDPTDTEYHKGLDQAEATAYAAATRSHAMRPMAQEVVSSAELLTDLKESAIANGHYDQLPLQSPVSWENIETGQQLLPDDGCSPISSRRTYQPPRVALGSICVTSSTFLMESGHCNDELRMNQCSRPACRGFATNINARNMHIASSGLAEAIQAAAEGIPFPPMPENVVAGSAKFWSAHEADGGHAPPPTEPSFVPCAEATVNAINVGAERDYLCREYTAVVLNRQEERRRAEGVGEGSKENKWAAGNVTCVQAMEAFGVLDSLVRNAPEVPVAVIRTASNYDMYPLQKRYFTKAMADRLGLKPPRAGDDQDDLDALRAYVWHQNTGYVPADEYEQFVIASFHYSVKTATFVVSNYFLGGRDLSSHSQS